MSKKITREDIELLDELGVDTESKTDKGISVREQRIIAGFEDIVRFYEENGRIPLHGDDLDIFERIYAVRLDSLIRSSECFEVLKPLDKHGILDKSPVKMSPKDGLLEIDDDKLLQELGVDQAQDVTRLVHVRAHAEIKAAEEVAQKNKCSDFDRFRPLFDKVQHELNIGVRQTFKFQDNAEVNEGDLFILDGQKIVVAELGVPFVSDYGRPDRRLRVVYDNGTESDLLLRSLQRALNKDKASRRISINDLGPLFSGKANADDQSTGFIYVLRSLSDNEFIAANRSLIHKIGVTAGDVKTRVANARKDPTYLLADVEVVATYKLININHKKIESLLHGFFSSARLDFELKDRFGFSVLPREWFLVPLPAIVDVFDKLIDGSITNFVYDPKKAKVVPVK